LLTVCWLAAASSPQSAQFDYASPVTWWFVATVPSPTVADTHWASIFIAVGSSVTALGIVAATYAAFWAGKQASESKSSRHASTALETASRWGAPDLIQSRSAVAEYAREGRLAEKFMAARAVQSDAYYEISRLMDFFEDLAALEMIGGISLDWVCLTMKPSVLEYWETVRYTVDEMRKDEPEAYVCFECLVQKVRQAGKRGKQ
jgi:hypothetical protein